jgi:OmpA-OmpF porin, OOP family
MNFKRRTGTLGLATLAALASTFAAAQEPGWYAGAAVGRSETNIDDARITSGLLGAGLTTTGIADRDRSTGYKLFGGYELNRFLAIEGGYFDLGKFGFTATTAPAGTLTGDIRLRGFNLDVLGTVPITSQFSAFGRVGANYAQARDRFAGTGAVQVLNPTPRARDTNVKYGLGVRYDFTPSLGVRLEAERYKVNDAVGNKGHVDLVSLGLVYRFGGRTPEPVQPMVVAAPPPPPPPPPVVVAPPPPPPPPPAPPPPPPPPPPQPVKVSFSADSLFGFDSSDVKPEGKQALDKFAADLRGVSYDAIQVTGHTDRIGAKPYNLKLSTRRAEAVSAYLSRSAGIPAGKITARGVNGDDPVTKPGDCKGSKPTRQLIECLQPDRRVEVEVTGSK